MSPSPDQQNEPKAPDKSGNKLSDVKTGKVATGGSETQEEKVSALDDGQLRDLLEEAVSYKCPKDRHGKSPLFKELLQRAEADERNQRATNASGSQVVRHYNTAYSQRNRNKHSKEASAAERNSHGGSLQNLYQVNDHTANRKARKKTTSASSVSARQREGGSLPSCNIVPIDKITFEKPPKNPNKMDPSHIQAAHALSTIKPEYTTIDLSNAEPEETQYLIEDDSLSHLHSNDVEMTDLSEEGVSTGNSDIELQPRINYTSSYSMKIGVDSRKPVSTDVDASVVISVLEQRKETTGLETTPWRLATNNYNVHNLIGGQGEVVVGGTTRGRSSMKDPTAPIGMLIPHLYAEHRISSLKESIGDKKNFDENGNTVSTFNTSTNNSSSTSNSSETRKQKKPKPKTDRNVTISKPESFKGFCGDKDVDSLVKFIEATNNDSKQNHKNKSNIINNVNKNITKLNESKKRSTERKSKDKSEKLKKSNSLEEISKTKIEDLTTESGTTSLRRATKKQATFDDIFPDQKGDRRSWGTEEGQQYYCNDNLESDKQVKKKSVKPDIINTATTPELISLENFGNIETSDFHVVTKKKKSKKRRSTSGGRSTTTGNLFNDGGRVGNNYYQRDNMSHPEYNFHHQNSSSPDHHQQRRKSTSSMPPSDKSNDSSDLDSVHSLPVESTSLKMCLQQVSTSSGGTPQASYADIAKMALQQQQQQQQQQNTQPTSNCLGQSNPINPNTGIVDIKNVEKWPSVSHKNNKVMPMKNYNFPDLIIDNCNNDGYGNYDKMFTTCTEIEAKHLSEAKNNFRLKNGLQQKRNSNNTSQGSEQQQNTRILQEQYPALEKTISNNKKLNNSNINNNKNKYNKNNNNININNSEVPTIIATKGCDIIDKKLSIATTTITTITSQPEYNNISSTTRVIPTNNITTTNNQTTPPNHTSSQLQQRKSKKSSNQTPSHNSNQIANGTIQSTRPAVIILNDIERSSNSSGITFGFDINEKLLFGDSTLEFTDDDINFDGDGDVDELNNMLICRECGSSDNNKDNFVPRTNQCNKCVTAKNNSGSVCSSASSSSSSTNIGNLNKVQPKVNTTKTNKSATEDFTARYVEPAKMEEAFNYNHDKIVTFVGLAWEDIVNQQNNGKVQYYSGQ